MGLEVPIELSAGTMLWTHLPSAWQPMTCAPSPACRQAVAELSSGSVSFCCLSFCPFPS